MSESNLFGAVHAFLARCASFPSGDEVKERAEAVELLEKLQSHILGLDWAPIHTAPRDGTLVDLWIRGPANEVSFYVERPSKAPTRQDWRQGRATGFKWHRRAPNPPNWYPEHGLSGYPISPEIEVTHWRPLPSPPGSFADSSTCQIVRWWPMKALPKQFKQAADPLMLWSPTTHTYVVVGRFWTQDNVWLADEPGRDKLQPEAWATRPHPPIRPQIHRIRQTSADA